MESTGALSEWEGRGYHKSIIMRKDLWEWSNGILCPEPFQEVCNFLCNIKCNYNNYNMIILAMHGENDRTVDICDVMRTVSQPLCWDST